MSQSGRKSLRNSTYPQNGLLGSVTPSASPRSQPLAALEPVECVELPSTLIAMAVETVPGTLRGYRAWRVMLAAPLELHPVGVRYQHPQTPAWDGIHGTARCECVTGIRHSSPSWGCTCGLYARYNSLEGGYDRNPILGSIQAHGRIIIQEQGFRSQFAKVEALALGSAWRADMPWHALQLFGQVHNIPVFHSLAELQERFPPEDVSRWIEPRKNAIQDAYLYGAMLTGIDLEEFKKSAMNAWPAEKYRRFDKEEPDANTDGR